MKKSPPASSAAGKKSTARPRPAHRRGPSLALLEFERTALASDLRRVRFGYFNPDARQVSVAGSFNGWDTRGTPLKRDEFGGWAVEIDLPVGEHRYRLFVDGDWRDDPTAQQTAKNPFGGYDAIVTVV